MNIRIRIPPPKHNGGLTMYPTLQDATIVMVDDDGTERDISKTVSHIEIVASLNNETYARVKFVGPDVDVSAAAEMPCGRPVAKINNKPVTWCALAIGHIGLCEDKFALYEEAP